MKKTISLAEMYIEINKLNGLKNPKLNHFLPNANRINLQENKIVF
jgi:hypothetical protein